MHLQFFNISRCHFCQKLFTAVYYLKKHQYDKHNGFMSQLDGGAESESDKTGDSEREYFASEAKIQAEIRKENFVFALFLALEKGTFLG